MGFKIYRYLIGAFLLILVAAYAMSLNYYFQSSKILKVDRIGKLPNKGVASLALSPDDKFIAAGDDDRFATLMDKRTRTLWRYGIGLNGGQKIGAVAVSTNARRVAAGGNGGVILIFDRFGEPLQRFEVEGAVTALGLSSSGRRLIAGTAGGLLYRFDNETLTSQTRLAYPIEKMQTDRDARRLLITSGSTVSLQEFDKVIWSKPGIKAAALATNGRRILAVSEKDRLNLIDRSGKTIWSRRLPHILAGAEKADVAYNSGRSAVTIKNRTLFLNENGRQLAAYRSPDNKLSRAALTATGRQVLIGAGEVLLIQAGDAVEAPLLRSKITAAALPAMTALTTVIIMFLIWRRLQTTVSPAETGAFEPEEEAEQLAA